jgi:hypothetical protein
VRRVGKRLSLRGNGLALQCAMPQGFLQWRRREA